jgi:phage terminase large subunit-like protein
MTTTKRFPKDSYSWRAYDYAKRVTGGKIPACLQARQACQRFIDDFARTDIVFDTYRVDHVCEFAEQMPHVVGPLAGEKIKLEPFQVFLLANLFGWLDSKTKLRRFREAFVLLPRGNAKSTIAAIIGLYMTFCLGQGGAQGFSGATSLDQANAVFTPAKAMVEMNPVLAEELGIETAARSIFQLSTSSSFKSVRAQTKDGGIPWIAIADELHQAIDNTQLQAFRTGMGKRRGADPMLIIISTAGVNLGGVCYQEQRYFESILDGSIRDDAKFALIYTIDKADSWRDFTCWKKANPNYGVSVDEDHLRREYDRAMQSPAAQAECRTKYLNEWVASATGWINQNDWSNATVSDFEALTGHPLTEGELPTFEALYAALAGRPAGLGVDLSTQLDLTSVVAVVLAADGRRVILPFSWVPPGSIERSKNAQAYAQWIDSGDMLACDGDAIDLAAIEDKIVELCAHFRVTQINFDPRDAVQMQQNLMAKGHPVVTFGQNAMNYTPVMAAFEADLVKKTLVHPDNKVLNWCAANVSIRADRNSNMLPSKPDRQEHLKIDTMVAALMAYHASEVAPEAAPSLFFI